MKSIHKQRLLLMLVSATGAISIFLPWLKTEATKTNGFDTGTAVYFVILCFIGTVVLCTYGEKEKPLSKIHQYITAALCAISAIIGISKVLTTIGIGLILLQICGIAGVVLALNISRKKESPLNPPKGEL